MSDINMEKDLSAATDMFKSLYSSLKSSFPIWEDFLQRGHKFQKSLEQMIVSFNAFLDGFARLSEVATQSQGAMQEIGNNMVNLVRWHKGLELKIREINYSLNSKILTPMSNRVDEWKKSLSALEKDHDKEMHKALKESKESLKSTVKAKKTLETKKKKKDKATDMYQQQYDQLLTETDAKIADAELKQKVHLSRIMVEERVWFSTMLNAYLSVLDHKLTIKDDLERLPNIMADVKESSSSPSILPEDMREYVENWEIPTSSNRYRTGSVVKSTSNPSIHSDNSMDISEPIVPALQSTYITSPQNTVPTLSDHTHPPPTAASANYGLRSNPPEEAPVAAVTISPSQVSLVSTGSHQSTSDSSTRSISPPLAHRSTIPSHHLEHRTSSYQTPQASYQTPQTSYQTPQTSYQTQQYNPQQQYQTSQTQYQAPQTQHYAVPNTTSGSLPTVSSVYSVPRTQAQPLSHVLGNQSQSSPQHMLGSPSHPSPQHVLGNQSQPSPQHVLGNQSQPSPQHVLGNQSQPSPQHQEQPLTIQQELLSRKQRSVDYGSKLFRTSSAITAEDMKYSTATLRRHGHHPPSTKPKPSRAPSLPNHAHSDNEDEAEESEFAKALRQKKLRKTAESNDRSAPKL